MAQRGPKRTRGQREYDLILVSEMYLRGETQEAIAVAVSAHYEGFNLTRQQMGYDIKQLHRRWVRSQLINIDEAKARELARVDKIEREAWDAWERSKQDAETITTKGRGTKDSAAQMEKTIQLKGQVGDGTFLRVVQWCVEQRCKILGLDAAGRHLNLDMTLLSTPQLERIAAGEDPIHVLATTAAGTG